MSNVRVMPLQAARAAVPAGRDVETWEPLNDGLSPEQDATLRSRIEWDRAPPGCTGYVCMWVKDRERAVWTIGVEGARMRAPSFGILEDLVTTAVWGGGRQSVPDRFLAAYPGGSDVSHMVDRLRGMFWRMTGLNGFVLLEEHGGRMIAPPKFRDRLAAHVLRGLPGTDMAADYGLPATLNVKPHAAA